MSSSRWMYSRGWRLLSELTNHRVYQTAYHLDGKPGNFGENSNGRFILEEIFREKSNTFRGITFFRFLPKRPKVFLPFFWITSARLQVERKRKIYLYFVNGTTQSRPCFRHQKRSQYHLTEIFQRNFRTNGKLQLPCSFRAVFLNALSPLSWSLEQPRLKWVEKVGPRYLVIQGVLFSAIYYRSLRQQGILIFWREFRSAIPQVLGEKLSVFVDKQRTQQMI